MEYLIASPLIAAVKAQRVAAETTRPFIASMIDDKIPEPITVNFNLEQRSGDESNSISINAPLLALVPHLRIDSLTTHFHFEISQTWRSSRETSGSIETSVSSGKALSPRVSASLKVRPPARRPRSPIPTAQVRWTSPFRRARPTSPKAWRDFSRALSHLDGMAHLSAADFTVGFARLENLGPGGLDFNLSPDIRGSPWWRRLWWGTLVLFGVKPKPRSALYRLADSHRRRGGRIELRIQVERNAQGRWQVRHQQQPSQADQPA